MFYRFAGCFLLLFLGRSITAQTTSPSKSSVRFDRFGQSALVDFPEKVRSEEDLRADVARDEAYYKNFNPPSRDAWGGLPGSRETYHLKKTGFFHIERVGRRQVLVSPEGNLYFMLATGGVFPSADFLTVEGHENEFEWLPSKKGRFKMAWRDNGRKISFATANFIRKYNCPWDIHEWQKRFIDRLRAWGFNGMNSYGRPPGIAEKTSYATNNVLLELTRAEDMSELFETFFDPFDPAVRAKIESQAKDVLEPYANNPAVLGYYLNNEQHFDYIVTAIPALEGKVPAKVRLVEMLRTRYCSVQKFNQAWNMNIRSFDELDKPFTPTTPQAGRDMKDYEEIFLDEYFRFLTDLIRKYDTNHLLLGSRLTVRDAKDEVLNRMMGKYVDAISVNYYTYYFNKSFLETMHKQSGGRPMLLSEWNYDAADQGLMNHLRGVKNQKERGLAYRNYVEQAASLPFVLGVQLWCTLDYQPQQWNTGLVNIADRPYKDYLAEVVKTNYTIYDVVLGKRKPFQYQHPNFLPRSRDAQKVVEVPRALPGMKVDGVQSPWPDRPSNEIGAQQLVWGAEAGESGLDYWLCWDSEYLYLYAVIEDATPQQNRMVGRGFFKGDALEIFIGVEKPDQSGPLLFTDRQLLISLGDGKSPQWYWVNSTVQYPLQMVVKNRADGQGCILEVAIPFTALGLQHPKPGMEFLFDIGLDDSKDGLNRQRQFMWNGTADNSVERDGWGRARLSE